MEEKEIRMFISGGDIIFGAFIEEYPSGKVKLSRPLKMILSSDGKNAQFNPLYIKEEWAKLPPSAIELECPSALSKTYEEAATGIFSSIIMPTSKEKLILGR